jgi:hypothetical protein
MASTISGHSQKVDDLLQNQWTVSSGIDGRHVPELVVDFPRIMQSSSPESFLIYKNTSLK